MRRPIRPRSASTRPAISVAMCSSSSVCGEVCPAFGRHQLRPTAVEAAMIAFAVTVVACQCPEIRVELLAPQTHFVAQGIAASDHASSGLRAALPVVHIILLKSPRRAERPHAGQANRFFDRGGGGLVGKDPCPYLGLVGPPWVPDPEGARHRP